MTNEKSKISIPKLSEEDEIAKNKEEYSNSEIIKALFDIHKNELNDESGFFNWGTLHAASFSNHTLNSLKKISISGDDRLFQKHIELFSEFFTSDLNESTEIQLRLSNSMSASTFIRLVIDLHKYDLLDSFKIVSDCLRELKAHVSYEDLTDIVIQVEDGNNPDWLVALYNTNIEDDENNDSEEN